MNQYDVIIIGGGAGGLMCALELGGSGKKVAILEAGYSLGKKILVTGNGRCNLTNKNIDSDYYNHILEGYFSQFNEKDTIKFFNSIGLETFADECGRVYPFTNTAKSVVDVIIKQLGKYKNIEVFTNCKIEKVQFIDNNYVVCDKLNKFVGKNLVIACGNVDNDFLQKLKIKLIERVPSLVALRTVENTKNLDGVRIANVKLTAICNDKKKVDKGEVLFKDGGISGIAVFNLSTLFSRNKSFNGIVIIDLLPNLNLDQTVEIIKSRCQNFVKVGDIFTGLFVDAIRSELFSRCKIDEKLKSNKLSDSAIKRLANEIHNLKFNINGHFDNNQVVSGGIDMNEVNNRLESNRYSGLYFVGEVLDVDGECGGYNLQWAWTSGAIVGKHLNKL